jgi:predicted nuclease of predicted toxin-antitoxin system
MVSSGHDAKTVYDQQLQGVDDPVLMDRCDQENRILVTLDIDFQTSLCIRPKTTQEFLFYDLAINRRRMFSMSFTRY